MLGCQTRRARLHCAKSVVYEWFRDHQHDSFDVQHAGLRSRLQVAEPHELLRGEWKPADCGVVIGM